MLWSADVEVALRRHARRPPEAQSSVDSGQDEQILLARHGRTFHFATRFMPETLRGSVVTLYAFFRTLDDLVDVPDASRDPKALIEEIEAWRGWFLAGCQAPAPREPLGAHLAAIVQDHQIPTAIFLDFLRGMAMDIEPREIERFADLREYCYCVAGTVGLAMAHLLGARSAQALQAAEELGVAMQLTNVLRDVGGDLRLGRVYLPAEEMLVAGISREHLSRLVEEGKGPDEAMRALLREQVERAYACYQRGMAGIWLLPEDVRLPILIAARLYRAILRAIHRNDYDVLRWRAATSLPEKTGEALRALALVTLWRGGERAPGGQMEMQYAD